MTAFTPKTIAALDAPLVRDNVKQREQAGRKLFYIEGWHAIAEANRIFGFDGWTRQTLDIRSVSERERKIGKPPNTRDGWGVSYVVKVRVTVGDIVREGIGAGHGIDVDLGLAHESAIKEAETDAMKRALMTFGNPFGLALYDKEQANVADGPTTTELLTAAEASLRAAAENGMAELETVWNRTDPDLCVALETLVNKTLVPLAKKKAKAA
jgi:DNA recombination protein Rad52